MSDRYGFDRLLTAVSSLSRTDRWETLARAALRDDLYALLREFTAAVVSHEPPPGNRRTPAPPSRRGRASAPPPCAAPARPSASSSMPAAPI